MRIRGWLAVLCVVTLTAFVTLVVTDLRRDWEHRVDEAQGRLAGLSWTLEEQAANIFQSADVLLRNIVAGTRASLLATGELPSSFLPILARNVELIDHVEAALLVDRDGIVLVDTAGGGRLGLSLADCGCFSALSGMSANETHIDSFTAGAGAISLARRLEDAEGVFRGAVIALVDASYLEGFYEGVRVGDSGIISLSRTDGLTLVQAPRDSVVPEAAADSRVLVAQRDFASLPLTLTVSTERHEILAGWENRWFWSVIWLVAIAITIILLVVYLWVQVGRNQRTTHELTLQKTYFQQLFDGSPEGIVILDNSDRVVDANLVFQEMFGYAVDEVRWQKLNDLILPDHLREEASRLSKQVLEEQTIQAETVRRRKDGTLIDVSILGVPVTLHGGQVGVYGIYRDIGLRIASERKLRENEERYRIIAEQTGQIVYDYDVLSGKITWSGAIQKIVGHDFDEFQGVDIDAWAGMLHPEDSELALRLLEDARRAGGVYQAEYRMQHKSGAWVFIEDNGVFLKNNDGVVYRMLGTLSDITERKRITSEMAWQASHDALTGLFNRHEFEERVARLLFNRRGRRRHALLYIDLDQFKVVNDTCGHQAGDQLLRQLTALLATTVRETDTLARLGGDEFGLLLVDCPLDRAVGIAEKLILTVNEFRFTWDDQTFSIGASIGLVEITPRTDSVAVLFSAADSACYAAKDKGRNQVVVYREGDEDLAARHGEMSWVSRITKALEEDRFELHWQPIQRVASPDDGREHYELLLRMRAEDGALVSPAHFIPAAERYNLMPQVDRWVVREAFGQLATHGDSGLVVSINLSGTTLSSERFIGFVHDELQRTGVDPEAICYEITETAAIANIEWARKFIDEMHALGCRISLDDFGSGLSSFAYLKSLAVDYIKIDGAFVKDITDDQADKAMVEAIIRVGQVMGIRTVAEFVESAAILAALTEMGVDYAQGYHIGAPKPVDRGR